MLLLANHIGSLGVLQGASPKRLLCGMPEKDLVTSMIKTDGDPTAFLKRPTAGGLAAATVLMLWRPLLAQLRLRRTAPSRRPR